MTTITRPDALRALGPSEFESSSTWSADRRLPKQTSRYYCGLAILGADVMALIGAVAVAWGAAWSAGAVLWPDAGFSIDGLQLQASLAKFAILFAGVVLYLAAHGQYSRRIPGWSELQRLCGASFVALLCHSFVEFSLQSQSSRLVLIGTWVVFPFAAMGARLLVRRLLTRLNLWQVPVVIIGDGETAQKAASALLSEPGLGYNVVDIVSLASLYPASPGANDSEIYWRDVLRHFRARLLVLALDVGNNPGSKMAEALVRQRVPFAVMPTSTGLPVLGCERTTFFTHDTVLLSYRNNLQQPMARIMKVAFDLVAAAAMLVLLAPLMVVIAVLVKLDGGPVLFAHRRIGAGGRSFNCYKFRTMIVDSGAVLQQLLRDDPAAAAEWAATQKLRNDPRVTPIGAVLRKLSLDEVPQLFNVLRLEMSLVGPRPIVDQEARHYAEDIAYYYETRPGLTGLWQVSGRSDMSYSQRVRLDTWYVKNWTAWHDLAILAKTIPAVLKRKGAV